MVSVSTVIPFLKEYSPIVHIENLKTQVLGDGWQPPGRVWAYVNTYDLVPLLLASGALKEFDESTACAAVCWSNFARYNMARA